MTLTRKMDTILYGGEMILFAVTLESTSAGSLSRSIVQENQRQQAKMLWKTNWKRAYIKDYLHTTRYVEP